MSKKSGRIAELIENCRGREQSPYYLAYFECFNRGLFYEAHDVLEELWLTKRQDPVDGFYKGLIQFAGAFVHLQKSRLRPAVALFRLSQSYLGKYPRTYEQLDLSLLLRMADDWVAAIEQGDFQTNPLDAKPAPTLRLEP